MTHIYLITYILFEYIRTQPSLCQSIWNRDVNGFFFSKYINLMCCSPHLTRGTCIVLLIPLSINRKTTATIYKLLKPRTAQNSSAYAKIFCAACNYYKEFKRALQLNVIDIEINRKRARSHNGTKINQHFCST